MHTQTHQYVHKDCLLHIKMLPKTLIYTDIQKSELVLNIQDSKSNLNLELKFEDLRWDVFEDMWWSCSLWH